MAEKKSVTPDIAISVENLDVYYDKFQALGEVNLKIPTGLITALVGPSGCGKSTFLTSLNRLTDLVPKCRVKGRIEIGGDGILTPEHDVMSLRRRVGMVFQKPVPFPQTIRRNFEIPLRDHGYTKSDADDIMCETLRDVGLWNEVADRLDKSAKNLSGGQQQRLCIARALALKPEVILFDEPCSALDPQASAVVEDLITGLRGRVTVVIVTHNLAQAHRIADHLGVFWLRKNCGTIVESGPAGQIFSSPSDPDAAGYLSGSRG